MISQSSGGYQFEIDNPGGDSSDHYYTHRYIGVQKQLTGWSNITITLSNHNIPNGPGVVANAKVDIKIINGGLDWTTQMYHNHGTWNSWRDCWYHIANVGKFKSSYSMTTSYTYAMPSEYSTCYAIDVWSDNSSWFWGIQLYSYDQIYEIIHFQSRIQFTQHQPLLENTSKLKYLWPLRGTDSSNVPL